ncbi:RBBP9/YdeN family alpha/beta hydrolase [Telmatospirillum siberiense]|uniref:Alpha/beta hydrolase n=1 Tax=Telmatospirillum siberiense TaxID=382514 RepID=A0A2N3Q0Q4_9PROT|nr:alpha/beta hydrolase [Telmatospirillum siberiense]PKU26239.1 alpha/beta hydrolase [Telmatospirillum siberiense]
MTFPHHQETDKALNEAAARYDFVLVPGLNDSGPEHWQSFWQARHDFWRRVTQSRWNNPDIGSWIDATHRLLATCRQPAILVGHSFGALASCCVTTEERYPIAGLMLVAPAEPEKFEVEDRVPMAPLHVPTVVVASHNDPVIRFGRTVYWSKVWNADLADIGEAGHINAEAGFGPWPYGLEILKELVATIDHQRQGT